MEDFISSELSKIKKETPFRVPDNYFDDFPARLQQRLEAEKYDIPLRKNRIIMIMKPILGVAASFLLVFLLIHWPVKYSTNVKQAQNEENGTMSAHELINYVERVDENSFYALLDDSDIKTDITDEEVIRYIGSNVSEYGIFSATNINN